MEKPMPERTSPDCTRCGACCSFFPPGGIAVLAQDGEVPEAVIDFDEDGFRCMAVVPNTNRCVCLTGNVGAHVSCSIYGNRPTTCRDFEAGSKRCLMIRRAAGLEVIMETPKVIKPKRHLVPFGGLGKDRCQRVVAQYVSGTKTYPIYCGNLVRYDGGRCGACIRDMTRREKAERSARHAGASAVCDTDLVA